METTLNPTKLAEDEAEHSAHDAQVESRRSAFRRGSRSSPGRYLAALALLLPGCRKNTPHSVESGEATASRHDSRSVAAAWSCSTDADCQLNGVCRASDGTCQCDPAWTGQRCTSLDLVPPKNIIAAYPPPPLDETTASWGASVIRDDHGKYHMYVSEMTDPPDLDQWLSASRLVHATSTIPDGHYTREDVVMPAFAHNPAVVRTPQPDGRYLLFHIGCGTGKESTAKCTKYLDHRGTYETTNILSAESPWGPWARHDVELEPKIDTFGVDNPAPLMMEDGSILMLGRYDYSSVRRITAPQWQQTYTLGEEIPAPWVVEDPFLYRDSRGAYHALFHRGKQGGGYVDAGGHAFSEDGRAWTFTAEPTYTTTITTADGEEHTNWRRERPSLIFDESTGEPTHLITGLWRDETDGKTMTFIQRINTSLSSH